MNADRLLCCVSSRRRRRNGRGFTSKAPLSRHEAALCARDVLCFASICKPSRAILEPINFLVISIFFFFFFSPPEYTYLTLHYNFYFAQTRIFYSTKNFNLNFYYFEREKKYIFAFKHFGKTCFDRFTSFLEYERQIMLFSLNFSDIYII